MTDKLPSLPFPLPGSVPPLGQIEAPKEAKHLVNGVGHDVYFGPIEDSRWSWITPWPSAPNAHLAALDFPRQFDAIVQALFQSMI